MPRFIISSAPVASSIWQCDTIHRRCHFSSTPSLGGGRARVGLARPLAERTRRTTGPDDRLCHRRAAIGRAVLGGSSVGAKVREERGARSPFCHANDPTTLANVLQRAPTVVRGQHRAGRVSDRTRNYNMTGSGVYGATLEITRLTSASARPGLEPGPCKIHPVGTCHAVRMAKTNTQVCAMYVRVARGTWGRRRPTQAAERRHGRRLQ